MDLARCLEGRVMLPRSCTKYLNVRLLRDSVVVEADYFLATTEAKDTVIVRLSEEVFGVVFEIHKTPTCDRPEAQTLLVRAPDVEYRQVLEQALGRDGEISLPFFQLE